MAPMLTLTTARTRHKTRQPSTCRALSLTPRRDGEDTVMQCRHEKSDEKFDDDSNVKELVEFVVEK